VPTALLVLVAIGFVDGTTDVLFETVVQRHADPRHLGAVFGFSYAFITATMMSAIAVAPLLNGAFAPRGVLLGASAFLVVAAGIALLGPKPRADDAVAAPVRRVVAAAEG
jgi:MFS family permease